MTHDPILSLDLPGLKKLKSGKVREIFDLGDAFLLVATDRISAFDCVMPNGIPRKGEVLTQLSHFWFERSAAWMPNHLLARAADALPTRLQPFAAQVERRSMIVKKAKPLAIECVVRGYLAGSGWKEYQRSGSVCGVKLPPGLKNASKLPEPIFTPATKAEAGDHDENIDFARMSELIGEDLAIQVRDVSIRLYTSAAELALSKGLIIADTKFEFGLDADGTLVLMDEVLTPDSSRYWPLAGYVEGSNPPSYDKQFVRDWLEGATVDGKSWNKRAPAPVLPKEVVAHTSMRYREAMKWLME